MICPNLLFKAGIYQIRQESTGKRYIGSSVWLGKRCWTHRYDLNRGRHHCEHLQRSWSKRAGEGFVFEVLLYCEPRDAVAYEQLFIDALRPEYNTCPTAGSCLGHKLTDEHKAKIRAAHLGSKRTPETRARMVAAQKGRKPTEAVREASRAYWADPANSRAGIPLSAAHREAIREGSRKKIMTPQHLAKLDECRRKPASDEKREKLSRANRGKRAKVTEAQVRDIRAARRSGVAYKELSEKYGITQASLGDIVHGRSYGYVPDDV